jgi:hypothetical protein
MSGGLGRAGKSQKRAAAKDAAKLSKDSVTIKRDLKNNRYMTIAATVRDMDRTLKFLDQQMENLEKLKQTNQGNAAVQRTVKNQKAILRAQKKYLKKMKKQDAKDQSKTALTGFYPVDDYNHR